MNTHGKLNYIEYPASNLEKTKAFFQKSFGWEFQDFGAEYTSFSNQGLDGGFFKSELSSTTKTGVALLVFFSNNLQETLEVLKVLVALLPNQFLNFLKGGGFISQNPVEMNLLFGQINKSITRRFTGLVSLAGELHVANPSIHCINFVVVNNFVQALLTPLAFRLIYQKHRSSFLSFR